MCYVVLHAGCRAPWSSSRMEDAGTGADWIRSLLHDNRGLMQEEELNNLGFHEEGMKKIRNKTFEGKKEGTAAAMRNLRVHCIA